MTDRFYNWLLQNATTELFALIFAAIMTLIVTAIYSRIILARALRRLRSGDHSDLIVVQLNHVCLREDSSHLLILRNLAGGGTVNRVFEGNPALAKMVRALAQKTDPGHPQLPFSGPEGMQAIHTLVNHVIESSANANFPLAKVLVTATCEDKRFLRRTQIRIFVMREDELKMFLDPKFCVRVFVEKPWQSIRVLALHLWAKQFIDQGSDARVGAKEVAKTWLVELPIRNDYSFLHGFDVDWTGGMEAEALTAAGLRELFQREEQLAEGQTPD